jgi:regulator of protease activity HflC (stomatin/prohibitin superfamily)
MRAELGRLTLDQTFEERDRLNKLILNELSVAVEAWGMKCLRYEIRDIHVSETIRKVMNLEAEAERQKRADILKSEGRQISEINLAEAVKRSKMLVAEGKHHHIF